MPVGVVLEFPGGTLDQYDEVVRRMGFSPGGAGATNSLFHWVAAVDGGIRVTDVWESKEAFDAFAEEKIGPITQEVGVPGPPTLIFYDVHNHLTAG